MVKEKKDWLWLIISFVAGFALQSIPAPAPMTQEGMQVLGIFLTSLLMWITISIDWPSLITIFLLGLLPHFGFANTLKGTFGNTTVAFLLFTFMLVYPLSQTNFVRRCTVTFITNTIARKGPWSFITFLFFAVTFMGIFISPSVLFVAFMPFLEDIFKVLGLTKGSPSANMIMLGTAFCISLSSGMSAIGHVWPTMAIGYFNGATGQEITQFQYMTMGIPTGIVLVILMILVFKFLFRPSDISTINPQKAMSLRGVVPKADTREWIILGTMALVVLLWIGPSLFKNVDPTLYKAINKCTTAMPPLLGCIILFICRHDGKPIMNFKEVMSKGVLWASIVMTGAATMLGVALTNDELGIKAWLSGMLGPVASGLPIIGLLLFFFTWCVLETNFSSNIVTTTVVSAVALSVCQAMPEGSVSVGAVVCLIGFGAGICNMTPAGQATINTVAIGSGWTTAKDMFIWGGVFAILAILCMTFIGYPLGSLFIG